MNDVLYRRIYDILSGRQSRSVETTELYAVGSIVGSVRNRNEDIGAVVTVRHGRAAAKDFAVALVCDGMGGMSDGRIAALTAASTFIATILRSDRFSGAQRALMSALNAAQRAVYDELRGNGGTTLSAVFLDGTSEAWLVHVGDSRIYEVRAGFELRPVTRDDTIGAALQRQQDNRPDNNRLIQFVGLDGELDPQIRPIERNTVSGLLLTSDGAHSPSPEILATIAKHAKSGPELVRKLLNVADAFGGLDNATAVHLPTVMATAEGNQHEDRPNEDIVASILCSSGQHDIWFTESAIQRAPSMSRPDYRRDEEQKPATNLPSKNKPPKKPKQPKGKKKESSSEELPLIAEKPIAKLDFSDDGDGKS
ncbi:serine/threonine-protein phosphatase [Agrobacterium tumefaciens]|uniref:Serine/threonine-protein phosphatase n=1 Tax=Agrobacterium tumefaciens TaxID=358 RepID=A0A546XJD8_AGRTU|nr:serine/threonine-protein phosphatase [Agrobacterium tumefaciens]